MVIIIMTVIILQRYKLSLNIQVKWRKNNQIFFLIENLKRHYLRRTSLDALSALQTVGMQIAYCLTTSIVRRELHGTYTRTTLALHLTGTRHVDVRECFWQWSFLRCYPVGDGSHGTKRTPCAWCIDERKRDTNDGSHDDNRPKDLAYTSPHGKSTLAPRHKA